MRIALVGRRNLTRVVGRTFRGLGSRFDFYGVFAGKSGDTNLSNFDYICQKW